MNNIKRTAKKYIKAIKKRDLANAVKYLKGLGYEVIFFNTPLGNNLIKAYGLEWDTETKKAFTCYEENNVKTVFVDDSLHNNDKLYLLLHETGHILLKHIGEGQDVHCDVVRAEVEADAFAYEVLNYKDNSAKIAGTVMLIVFGFISGYLLSHTSVSQPKLQTSAVNTFSYVQQTPEPASDEPVYYNTYPENSEDVVYVTTSGTKYHMKDCRYVKNKTNTTALSIEQAQKKHTPCSVCNP